jgi:hypothetical protein
VGLGNERRKHEKGVLERGQQQPCEQMIRGEINIQVSI